MGEEPIKLSSHVMTSVEYKSLVYIMTNKTLKV